MDITDTIILFAIFYIAVPVSLLIWSVIKIFKKHR
jgi:hypothetical protein